MENSSKYKLIVGTVISKVIVERDNDQYIEFQTTCGVSLRMHHIQDCCEQVYIEDIVGDIQDLVGEKILSFEEKTNSDKELYKEKIGNYPDSITWTFYTIRTINTTIDIRWLGESNGHYSEGVYFNVKYIAKSDGELNKIKNMKKEYYKVEGEKDVLDILLERSKFGFIEFVYGNIFKYSTRIGRKDPSKTLEDLEKALEYNRRLLVELDNLGEDHKEYARDVAAETMGLIINMKMYIDKNKDESISGNNEDVSGNKKTIFDSIRGWANDRGIYEKSDVKSQFIKLTEEVGELSRSILKDDEDEFVDAIGDCIVVLTNLAKLKGYNIEYCIDSAYNIINSRKGKMSNGTFVKD